ncbi:cytochrome P450 [Mycena filopes]|nr:cytochrome P450 [Mycena filopes]
MGHLTLTEDLQETTERLHAARNQSAFPKPLYFPARFLAAPWHIHGWHPSRFPPCRFNFRTCPYKDHANALKCPLNMHTILRFTLPFIATAVVYVILSIAASIIRDLRSPLKKLVGPKSSSFVWGSVKDLQANPHITRKWRAVFGATFQFKSLFNTRELYTVDVLALDHILKNNSIYQKRGLTTSADIRLSGEGLLGVEGEAHLRQFLGQRRIMNPAFGTAQIRSLTEIFLEKSVELRDIWASQIGDGSGTSSAARIDVLEWLSKMTLDVIGQAGFDYQFDTMHKSNAVHEAFHNLFHFPGLSRQVRAIQPSIPLLRHMPPRMLQFLTGTSDKNSFSDGRRTLFTLGRQLLVDGKAAITAAGGPKAVSAARDLFSLILRANMASDVPEDHRMSDNEVIGCESNSNLHACGTRNHQVRSSLLSTAIAWALQALSTDHGQRAQTRLREELLSLPTDTPTLDELNSLPYLDAVVRETLRVHAPVAHVTRVAAVDDVLPLATPCFDAQLRALTSLHIPKGLNVRIPIGDLNTDPAIWGADAGEFKPERWEKTLPKAAESIPGVWGNMLTFLGGPHNCIGFRFSLAEQKAILFVLIRAFTFSAVVREEDFRLSDNGLQTIYIVGEEEKGSQMPLIVGLYQA